jgi:hypothetical protein
VDHLDSDFPDPEALPAPVATSAPVRSTSAPRQRAQRPSSTVRQQKPFTKLRGNTKSQQSAIPDTQQFTQTVTYKEQLPQVHQPTYEDYYDAEPDAQPTYSNKVCGLNFSFLISHVKFFLFSMPLTLLHRIVNIFVVQITNFHA